MEDSHGVGKRLGNYSITGRGSKANGLSVARKIASKPGRVYTMELKFGEEERVRNDIETFTEVKQAEKRDMTAVHVRENAVGN